MQMGHGLYKGMSGLVEWGCTWRVDLKFRMPLPKWRHGGTEEAKISGKGRASGKQIDLGTGCLYLHVNLSGKIHQAKGCGQPEAVGQFSKHACGAEQEQRDLRISLLNKEGQGACEEKCPGVGPIGASLFKDRLIG